MTAQRRIAAAALALVGTFAASHGWGQAQVPRGSIESLVSQISFGIPTSPAFALLPDQPSEVEHIATPHDFQSAVTSWLAGGKVRTGAALDFRPFSEVGSLREYQRDVRRQIAWRTVFSAGTAPAEESSPDVLVAAGLRIPVIDRADPRADTGVVNTVERAYRAALRSLGPPPLDASPAQIQERADSAARLIQPVRDSLAARNWNRFKWDVGIAGAARARNGSFRQRGLVGDRGGFWTAVAVPVTPAIQATGTAKLAFARADSVGGERLRGVVGARFRVFPHGSLGLSAEAAQVFANYRQRSDLNENWTHLGAVLEFPSTFLAGFVRSGWIAVGYGGDINRRGNLAPQFSFQYAFYQNRILSR